MQPADLHWQKRNLAAVWFLKNSFKSKKFTYFFVFKDSQLCILISTQLSCGNYMNLFWIPIKTLNFSNECSVVKTHERDNLPTSPSKTVKLIFINQKREQILVLDSLEIFVVLPYFGLHHCQRVVFDCHGLIWITGDCVSLHLNAIRISPNTLQK